MPRLCCQRERARLQAIARLRRNSNSLSTANMWKNSSKNLSDNYARAKASYPQRKDKLRPEPVATPNVQ